jgi:hypothetical protein
MNKCYTFKCLVCWNVWRIIPDTDVTLIGQRILFSTSNDSYKALKDAIKTIYIVKSCDDKARLYYICTYVEALLSSAGGGGRSRPRGSVRGRRRREATRRSRESLRRSSRLWPPPVAEAAIVTLLPLFFLPACVYERTPNIEYKRGCRP